MSVLVGVEYTTVMVGTKAWRANALQALVLEQIYTKQDITFCISSSLQYCNFGALDETLVAAKEDGIWSCTLLFNTVCQSMLLIWIVGPQNMLYHR